MEGKEIRKMSCFYKNTQKIGLDIKQIHDIIFNMRIAVVCMLKQSQGISPVEKGVVV